MADFEPVIQIAYCWFCLHAEVADKKPEVFMSLLALLENRHVLLFDLLKACSTRVICVSGYEQFEN